MAQRSRRDDEYYDEEERTPRYASYGQKRPIIPFIAVGAVVVVVGLLIMLSASKKAEERTAAEREAAPGLTGLDIPDAPGYQKLRDVKQSSIKSAESLVLAVYSYGRHSTVQVAKRASRGYWNHDVRFIIADHDISRLTLGELAKAGVLTLEVLTTDCPLMIFIRNGRESHREKDMQYDSLQRQIDDVFHGGKASMPSES